MKTICAKRAAFTARTGVPGKCRRCGSDRHSRFKSFQSCTRGVHDGFCVAATKRRSSGINQVTTGYHPRPLPSRFFNVFFQDRHHSRFKTNGLTANWGWAPPGKPRRHPGCEGARMLRRVSRTPSQRVRPPTLRPGDAPAHTPSSGARRSHGYRSGSWPDSHGQAVPAPAGGRRPR